MTASHSFPTLTSFLPVTHHTVGQDSRAKSGREARVACFWSQKVARWLRALFWWQLSSDWESSLLLLVCKDLPYLWGLPGGSGHKESACQCRRPGLDPWVGKIPWRRKWQPTPVFLPGEFHGWRSLVGYSPRGPQRVRLDWVANTHGFAMFACWQPFWLLEFLSTVNNAVMNIPL